MKPPMVTVIGAGAAGLTAAMRAAESGAKVLMLNAHPRIGLKILMSGGTRCNVTHEKVTERDFNGGSRPFVARVLRAFPVAATLEWFTALGVELKLEPTGKYFPESDDAQTVLDALLRGVERAGVRVSPGARVVRLERGTGGGFRLGIQKIADSAALGGSGVARSGQTEWPLPANEPDRWVDADRVILATGGLSFPRTGSDGTGYALASALGHTLEPPVPALTPLAAEDPWCKTLQGLTVEAALRLYSGKERVAEAQGSLLLAHFGYTGPPALDLSRHWLRAGESSPKRRVTVSFMPEEREETLLESFVATATREPRGTVRGVLSSRLPERLITEICRDVAVDSAKMLSQISRAGRVRLASTILARELPVSGVLGYEKAEVTAGGVRLSEVNPSTLESRVVPGLYLCGEVLDVEGRLGGFNFQFAWSSGTVAGMAASA